jgi:hypothetical protein
MQNDAPMNIPTVKKILSLSPIIIVSDCPLNEKEILLLLRNLSRLDLSYILNSPSLDALDNDVLWFFDEIPRNIYSLFKYIYRYISDFC